MAHCVISSVLDTDTDRMEPCCMVHTHVAPCPRDGDPANPVALHSFDDSTGGRDAAVRAWAIRTDRQRPLVLHHGAPDGEHNTTSPGCWCGPELFAAARDG